jgi:sugar (pentulose or hexulose) kinase
MSYNEPALFNIYVAGFRPNNVVVISLDGQSHKVLLSDSEGFEIHRGIHCDRASNQLLSINGRNSAGSL